MRTPTYSSSAGRIHVRRPSARHLSLEGLFQPKLCHDDLLAEMPFFPSPLPCSCLCTSCWYVSLLFSSSSCRPIPKISPCRITTMRSASRTVERRWAMMITVRSAMVRSIACWTKYSLSASRADVASSSRRIFGSHNSARAMATRCFCPPLRCTPFSPTSVSNLSGNSSMKVKQFAMLATSLNFSSGTSSSGMAALRSPRRALHGISSTTPFAARYAASDP
mmetsp:Transcript_6397/g.24831  ORF Transcript_6397/g.24831 Transcript_6397/m.24831 type:complete len:221 (-) Transcript_6397:1334-1996(-)